MASHMGRRLSGSPLEACKEMADERYELSKADAERQRGRM